MPEIQETSNNLLAALPRAAYNRIRPQFEPYELNFADQVYDEGDPMTHVYFVETGIISVLTVISENKTIELAMVGSEGMVTHEVFLGVETSGNRTVVQGSGHAVRMTVEDFNAECERSDDLPKILRLFTHSVIEQISRSAICIRFHDIESRMAKWLMMTQDRIKSLDFQITQEFLSYMLGVRREAVNKVAGDFKKRKLIKYSRGNVTILDRKAVEGLACSCYGFIAAT